MGFAGHVDRYGWLGILPFALNGSETNGLAGVGACCPEDCQGECCMKAARLNKKDASACGWRNQADAKFTEAIIKWATEQSCADPSKIFATGFSMGGMLVNYLACHASHVIRGFAPISGSSYETECKLSRPVSYLSICGTRDDEAFCQINLEGAAEKISDLNGCSGAGPNGAAVRYRKSATSSCRAWDLCPQGNFVEVCQTEGLAHSVSGHLRPDNTSYIRPASDLDIVEYVFQKFSELVNGTILFWGEPTIEELRYKESQWPPPQLHDHPHLREGKS